MNLNDLMTTKYDYDYNHEQLHELLVNILAAGEITQDDNDEINKLLPQYTLDYNIIINYNIEEQKRTQEEEYQKLDDQKLNNSLPDLVDTLTGGGRSTVVQVGSDGKLYIDGNYVPKLKLVELDVQKLYANYAEINTLVANKATIQDLEATNAKIENLKADIGDFQDLTAVKADIQQLKTDTANINTALIGKAEITDLNAANANITALQSSVASINTLVGGNLTMDNISSLVLTSSKVTVDNGFIKNAMIDSITANKITSGSINTNLVNIQSNDGSMILNGSLQQFKDKNDKVRLQLGKDASGNFTFALFDETGTGQLITPQGITANAIGDGIIVNDMVADNANISGSKLDINSVVTEVNNGTTTLKASIVKLDDKNQTLDVAFNSMSTTVENNTSKINTNTTNISTAQGQIQTLISNTTVTEDGKDKTIKEAYSSLKSTVDGFSSKIANIDTIQNDLTTVKSNVSTIQQDLTNITNRVQSTETQVQTNSDTINTLDGQVKLGEDVEGNIIYVKDQVAQTTMDVKGIINKVGSMEANFGANGTVTNLVEKVSKLEQTASQFTMEFFKKVEDAEQGVNTIFDYITFDANGITIGQENYPVRLRLAKDRVVFLDVNNVELAYFRDDKLYVNNAEILDTIKIANYGFMPTANGSLTIGALS